MANVGSEHLLATAAPTLLGLCHCLLNSEHIDAFLRLRGLESRNELHKGKASYSIPARVAASGSVHDGSAACTAEPIRKTFVPVARCTWFETDGIKLRTALRPQTSLP